MINDFVERAPRIGLITLWYNGFKDLDRFAENLHRLAYPNIQHVFVIQKQTDDEVRRICQCIPQAEILKPQANLGTAAGWNLGINHLLVRGVDYIGIWNIDVTYQSDCIDRLVYVLENDRRVGAACPILLYSDEPEKIEQFGASRDRYSGESHHDYKDVLDTDTLPAIHPANYIDGGTMLCRSDLLGRLAGFDASLFMYGEDCDLCLRIQNLGYQSVAVRDAKAWHWHRQEKGFYPPPYYLFYNTRNRFYLVKKHTGFFSFLRLIVRMSFKSLRQIGYFIKKCKFSQAWAYICGLLFGVTLNMGKRGWVE
jgi:GT2 family glycosyltransferase